MTIQELIQIVYQCREVLIETEKSKKIISLINRIDQQLTQYSRGKVDRREVVNIRRSYSRSKSKRKIFDVVSKQVTPMKRVIGIKSPNSEILSPKADQFIIDSSLLSNSHLSQISLASAHLHTDSKISDDFHSLSHSTVNNSFDNLLYNQPKIQKQSETILRTQQLQQEVQIQDFFIIDYNFELKKYQVLPKRENWGDKCSVLSELEGQYNNSNKQQQSPTTSMSMIKKHSAVQKHHAINPFQQIIYNNNNRQSLSSSTKMNTSQLSMDSIIIKSIDQYSMQAQIDSSKSRISSFNIDKNEKKINQLYQVRDVIMNLVVDNTPENHIKEIKATSSMTDLLKLTTNPSSKNKTLQHIIIPSCLQLRTSHNPTNCNKYTHVIKTHQGINFGLRYFQCQRFFVIIQRKKNFLHIQSIIQMLISIKFYNQLIQKKHTRLESKGKRKQIMQFIVTSENMSNKVLQIALIPKQRLNKLSRVKSNDMITDSIYTNARMPTVDPLWQVSLYCQAAINFQFTLQLSLSSTPKSFHLVLILIYFIIFEYKIIFLTTKGYENIVSQIVNTLIHMMGQLRYIYPIIMAVLTNHHFQFVHAPVPGILAMWGKESRCKKAVEFMRRKLKQQEDDYMTSSSNSQSNNSLLTVVIDMNKHQFVDHSFTHKELFIIENLHNFVKRSNKQINFFDKMRYFFNEILLNDNPKNTQSQEKWIGMLRQRLRKTQMYEEYMKYQQTLQKSRRN